MIAHALPTVPILDFVMTAPLLFKNQISVAPVWALRNTRSVVPLPLKSPVAAICQAFERVPRFTCEAIAEAFISHSKMAPFWLCHRMSEAPLPLKSGPLAYTLRCPTMLTGSDGIPLAITLMELSGPDSMFSGTVKFVDAELPDSIDIEL